MFHLIKKYSNRKMYDTFSKSFITQDNIVELLIQKEEIRVEDSDSHFDITELEISKALMRYINNNNDLPASLKDLFDRVSNKKSKAKNTGEQLDDFMNGDNEILSYVPAEIRLLNKSIEYVQGAQAILKSETPFNTKLHDELYVLYNEFDRKLTVLKKKYRIT